MFGRGSSATKGSGSAKKDAGAAFNEKMKLLQVDTSSGPSAALAGHAAAGVKALAGGAVRAKSPKGNNTMTIPLSGKQKIPTVTMDDLFGSPRAGKVLGAPVIDLSTAYEAEDLPDVFKQATEYQEFDFGTSALDVDAKRPVSPIVTPASTGKPLKAPVVSSKASAKPTKKGGFLRNTFSANTPFSVSKSSFEAVFKDNHRIKEDKDDFEMESPFIREYLGDVKDAAIKVLSKQSEPLEDKARKLFFLDQLNKPAPPVVPPKLSPAAVSVAPRKSFVKRKKGVRHYDPSATALGVAGGASGFVPLVDVFGSTELDVGWRLRVEVLRDIAHQLMRIHDSSKAHNSLDNVMSTMLAVDTFRGAIADEKETVQPKKDDTDGVGRMKRDVLALGVLCLKACIRRKDILGGDFKSFNQLVSLETSCTDFAALDESLYSLIDDADREVREHLARAQTPGSLLELCAQCCSADRLLRPAAMDVWDWLDSIVGDMDKASGTQGAVNDNDQVDKMSAKLKQMDLVKHVVMHPKLADVSANGSGDDYMSDATSVTTDMMSVASNDSFQPPEQETSAPKPKAKLSDFMSQTSDEPSPRQRPQSLNISPNAAKLALFLSSSASPTSTSTSTAASNEAEDPAFQAGAEARQQERTRRRSLDRGYMWAKQKFASDDTDDAAKKKRMTRRIVAQDNVKTFEAQWKVAAVSTKTRKAEEIAQLFSNQERLPQDEALGIIKRAEQVMKKEKNLLEIKPPVVIVGDIHGQFFDLVNMMKIAGEPGKGKNKTSYLFLGDYVDRGDFSCEVLLYLLALKGEYPDSVFLLRGNHECRTVSSYFGFKEECEVKYGLTVFNRCVTAFQVMPIAGLVETQAGRFLCCHGGISPNITSLDQFKEYNRFVEPGMNGFLCDLLWSDPVNGDDSRQERIEIARTELTGKCTTVKDAHEDGSDMTLGDFLSIDYLPNPARGCSYRYGFKALVSFLAVNKLVALIRAHEVQMGGYRYHFQELTGGKSKTAAQVMPPVVTVFSAPNYTNKYGNLGAFLRVHPHPPFKPVKDKTKGKGAGYKPLELLEPVQFKEVSHPPPMQFRNQQAEQVLQITATCPYMPTTFHAFIKRATYLAELDNDEGLLEREKARASRALAPIPVPPPRKDLSKRVVEETDELDKMVEDAEANARPKSLGAKVLTSLGMNDNKKAEEEVVQVKADVASKKNWKALQQLGLDQPSDHLKGAKHVPLSERMAAEKFESAAENDGMNEMNPALLAEKVELAKQKIAEKHLGEDVTVFKASSEHSGPSSERGTLGGKNRGSVRLKVGDKSRPESMRDLKVPAIEEASGPASDEGAMSFSSKELLALQMLFLLVDRNDKGLIDEDDLIAWSAEEGYAVQRQEAEICLRAVDVDEDGKIGFEDYLAFAARSKDQWLVNEFSNVLNAVHTIQFQRSLDEMM